MKAIAYCTGIFLVVCWAHYCEAEDLLSESTDAPVQVQAQPQSPQRTVNDRDFQDQYEKMQSAMKTKFPRMYEFQEQLQKIQSDMMKTLQMFDKEEISQEQLVQTLRELITQKVKLENDPEYKVEQELMQMVSGMGGRPGADKRQGMFRRGMPSSSSGAQR